MTPGMIGFSPSETKAWMTWLSIGNRIPAMAATLQQAALDRKPGAIEIEKGIQSSHAVLIEQFGVNPVNPHRVATPRMGVALAVGMIQVQNAALADHRVVIKILLQSFPQLHREFVKRDVAGQQIVGADDRGVAPDIAAADPCLFKHRDVSDAVLPREIIGRRKTMTAAADDDHVIAVARFGVAPLRLPAPVAGESIDQQGCQRIAHGAAGPVGSERRLSRGNETGYTLLTTSNVLNATSPCPVRTVSAFC